MLIPVYLRSFEKELKKGEEARPRHLPLQRGHDEVHRGKIARPKAQEPQTQRELRRVLGMPYHARLAPRLQKG